ncbi:MAG TPA: isocitrate lyase/phosphoenolpyruvate mutase family protein [Terriglobales bacterium]
MKSPADKKSLKEQASTFLQMHHEAKILGLANVWDAASAVIIQQAGFPALATSSAGIAFSLGYPDGQKITRAEMLAAVQRIVSCENIPVTADVEAGYGDRPEDIADTTRGVLEAGAVGLNLEDATGDDANPLVDFVIATGKNPRRKGSCRSCGRSIGAECADGYLSAGGWRGGQKI